MNDPAPDRAALAELAASLRTMPEWINFTHALNDRRQVYAQAHIPGEATAGSLRRVVSDRRVSEAAIALFGALHEIGATDDRS